MSAPASTLEARQESVTALHSVYEYLRKIGREALNRPADPPAMSEAPDAATSTASESRQG
jgi:hypothetical protein